MLGEEFVLRQAQEEAGEFIVAINHYLRSIKSDGCDKSDGLHEMLKEFADLMICLMQIYIIGVDRWEIMRFVAEGIGKTLTKEKFYADS